MNSVRLEDVAAVEMIEQGWDVNREIRTALYENDSTAEPDTRARQLVLFWRLDLLSAKLETLDAMPDQL